MEPHDIDNVEHSLADVLNALIIACGPETPRFPPPSQEMYVFDLHERIIVGILADVEQQEAIAVVAKPVVEEQNVVSQILFTYGVCGSIIEVTFQIIQPAANS